MVAPLQIASPNPHQHFSLLTVKLRIVFFVLKTFRRCCFKQNKLERIRLPRQKELQHIQLEHLLIQVTQFLVKWVERYQCLQDVGMNLQHGSKDRHYFSGWPLQQNGWLCHYSFSSNWHAENLIPKGKETSFGGQYQRGHYVMSHSIHVGEFCHRREDLESALDL